jgi:hypothetical protein
VDLVGLNAASATLVDSRAPLIQPPT